MFKIILWLGCCLALLAFPVSAQMDRIASMNYCTDELLQELVRPEQIAALSIFSKQNKGLDMPDYQDSIQYIRGSSEEILKLRPNLVLAGAYSNHRTVEMIQRLGLPVLRLEVPQTFEGVYENLRLLGKRIGEEFKAEMLIKKMQMGLQSQTQAKKINKPIIIFIQDRGYVAGQDTFENEMIERLGAVNLAAMLGLKGHQKLSFEKLIMNPPDYIVFTTDQKERESLGRELLSHPIFRHHFPNTRILFYPLNKVRCASPASVAALAELNAMIAESDTL